MIGAAWVARLCQRPNVMSLDIGGTTADVALIADGQPQYDTGEFIGDYQIHIPSVSVTSIGDGGGSIAWVDDFGVLKVGPKAPVQPRSGVLRPRWPARYDHRCLCQPGHFRPG